MAPRQPRGITAQLRMRWFRHNIRHGSWLALIALAINLALSFGHVHVTEGQHSGRHVLAAAIPPHGGQTKGHSGQGDADDLCPICMAATAIANGLAPAPPALPLRLAYVTIDRATMPVAVVVDQQRVPFQSRGPPIS